MACGVSGASALNLLEAAAVDARVAPAADERSISLGAAPPPALRLDAISLSFGGVIAVADVDLAVQPGEIRAIIGANGAGKSSLINVISGLYRPNSGQRVDRRTKLRSDADCSDWRDLALRAPFKISLFSRALPYSTIL